LASTLILAPAPVASQRGEEDQDLLVHEGKIILIRTMAGVGYDDILTVRVPRGSVERLIRDRPRPVLFATKQEERNRGARARTWASNMRWSAPAPWVHITSYASLGPNSQA
jgi:hypothetical protein